MASPSTGIDSGRGRERDNSGLMREKLSVLIVDEDVLTCRVLETLFCQLKVAKDILTEIATDGKEALDRHLSGLSFDIILMEMDLPIKDGPKVTRELRAMGAKSMIVGLTSRDSKGDKEAFMAAGLDECLEKPLTADKLKSLVETLEKKK
ncbi:two-component response regulator 24-like [Rhodamnia argentea]|uniref:Two-component response regulator 24-like n=1 Tax=Rhodamnia argentea TaxID=178133 RepID=A0A8B8N1V1_9MYRT|nr:two-component response regulator 24-like [Rhodamnia argentea]